MSLAGKIKKVGGFVGKVAKGFASGGIRGALVSGLTNLSPGKKAQASAFASAPYRQVTQTYGASNLMPSGTITIQDDQTKKRKMYTYLGIGAGVLVALFLFFRKKRK